MNTIDLIKTDMYAAMKAGDHLTSGTLRLVLAKLKDRQINIRKDLTEKDCAVVLKTMIKQRKEAAEIYKKANRVELAEKENHENKILKKYLPPMMSKNETRILVNKVIEETEVKSLAEIGRVMPLIMERGKDKIDGKTANKILRELLE